jgi:hypothetical protein
MGKNLQHYLNFFIFIAAKELGPPKGFRGFLIGFMNIVFRHLWQDKGENIIGNN